MTSGTGYWQFLPVEGFANVELQLECSGAVLSFQAYGNGGGFINGVRIQDAITTGQSPFDQYSVPPFALPPIYDKCGRFIPYRQTLQFAATGGSNLRGVVQQLQHPPAMYSDTHHLQLRFLPLDSIGTNPFELTVDGAAVFLRVNSLNLIAPPLWDGIQLFNFGTGASIGAASVMQDWPPMYDPAGAVVPYRQRFRFVPNGQVINGCFTCIDIVPN